MAGAGRADLHLSHCEQVAGERLSEAECAAEQAATRRYNQLLSDSVFSLCPEGAGPNTLRLWESLAVGAIPVVIVEDWVWPSIPGAGLRWEDAVIKVRRDEVAGLFARLRRMRVEEPERLSAMQAAGRDVSRAVDADKTLPYLRVAVCDIRH